MSGEPPCARTMPAARPEAPRPARSRSITTTRSRPASRAKTEAQPPTVPAPTTTRSAASPLAIAPRSLPGEPVGRRRRSLEEPPSPEERPHAYSQPDGAARTLPRRTAARSAGADPSGPDRPADAQRRGRRRAVALAARERGVRDPQPVGGAARRHDRRLCEPEHPARPPARGVRLRAGARVPRRAPRASLGRGPRRYRARGRPPRAGPREGPRSVRGRRARRPRSVPGGGRARREPLRDPGARRSGTGGPCRCCCSRRSRRPSSRK